MVEFDPSKVGEVGLAYEEMSIAVWGLEKQLGCDGYMLEEMADQTDPRKAAYYDLRQESRRIGREAAHSRMSTVDGTWWVSSNHSPAIAAAMLIGVEAMDAFSKKAEADTYTRTHYSRETMAPIAEAAIAQLVRS